MFTANTSSLNSRNDEQLSPLGVCIQTNPFLWPLTLRDLQSGTHDLCRNLSPLVSMWKQTDTSDPGTLQTRAVHSDISINRRKPTCVCTDHWIRNTCSACKDTLRQGGSNIWPVGQTRPVRRFNTAHSINFEGKEILSFRHIFSNVRRSVWRLLWFNTEEFVSCWTEIVLASGHRVLTEP